MKKVIFLLIVCISIISCSKQESFLVVCDSQDLEDRSSSFVSKHAAEDVASLFFTNSQRNKNTKSDTTTKSVETFKDEAGNPLAYVISYESGGWVIVCANTNYYPILAYSEESEFVYDLQNMNSGLKSWIEEVSLAIKSSENIEPQTASAIAVEWLKYEPAVTELRLSNVPSGNSPEAVLCRTRLKKLNDTYYQDGWVFTTLSSQSGNEYFNTVRGLADQYGSPHQYTIVGLKDISTRTQVGPLLTTQWHQRAPYNAFCPNNNLAGCVAIAVAQIMRYHRYPVFFDWDNIPNVGATSATQFLIADVGRSVKMEYGPEASESNIDKAVIGLKSYGYSVEKADHNYNRVDDEILKNNRPIYMRGDGSGGHAWVCDGVLHNLIEYEYYVEYLLNDSYNNLGETQIDLPGNFAFGYYRYHMNWGWGGTSDGWYYDAILSNSDNYNNNRKNLYIVPR